jgi:hypothetical protein
MRVTDAGNQDAWREHNNESPHQERNTHAQGQNHQRVFTVISGLESVIPLLEQINNGTHKTDRQGDRAGNE